MKKVLLLVSISIILLVFSSPIFAAGGGGGGSGGGSSGGSSGSSGGSAGSSSSGSSSAYYSNVACKSDGSITFNKNPYTENKTVIATKDNVTFDVEGYWSENKFESEQGIFNQSGKYTIITDIGSIESTCPGFVFGCKFVNLKASSCSITDKGISAKIFVENIDIEKLKYVFLQNNTNLEYQKDNFNTKLKSLKITNESPAYIIDVENIFDISKFSIVVSNCIGRYYKYSTAICHDNKSGEQNTSLIEEDNLKCGGYLGIEDRVKCRLSLREEEKDEYENFFPEFCRSLSFQGQNNCLKVYKSVAKCWPFENGPKRIDCVKNELGIENINNLAQEVKKCDNTTDKKGCIKNLKKSWEYLIIFRIYNLEEAAEKLMEKRLLDREDVANFSVKVELKKQDFWQATNIQEKKQIINDVRNLWKDLISKVRVNE